jgi:hypothetical protein
MPSQPKTERREISEVKRAAVVIWHKAGKSYSQISLLEALKYSTIASIIRRAKLSTQPLPEQETIWTSSKSQ